MRSWIWTILGALLALLLWKTAQSIERFTADELKSYSGELATFKQQLQSAGKTLTDEESTKLEGFLKEDKVPEGLEFLKTLRGKYLGTEPSDKDRLDILTNLVDDARKRVAAIEKQSADAKEKGEQAQAKMNALTSGSMPATDLSVNATSDTSI